MHTTSTSPNPTTPIPAVHRFPDLGFLREDLVEVERHLDGLVQSVVPSIPTVGRYLLRAGGKRLRPMLTLLSARVAGADPPPIGLASVGEMIHLASLLHDDVVDEGTLRRGRTVANRVYGNGLTVLVGDFCLASALRECTASGLYQAVDSLAITVKEMAEGEVLQLQHVGRLETDVATYLQVIEKKSAALISWCCHAGALAGKAELAEPLAAYGRSMGIAFQIADDVLDYAGEVEETGKALTADLRGLKLTLPLLIAVARQPELRDRLDRAWTEQATDAELGEVASLVVECGALEEARARAIAYSEAAIVHLEGLDNGSEIGREARQGLEDLARYVVERRS